MQQVMSTISLSDFLNDDLLKVKKPRIKTPACRSAQINRKHPEVKISSKLMYQTQNSHTNLHKTYNTQACFSSFFPPSSITEPGQENSPSNQTSPSATQLHEFSNLFTLSSIPTTKASPKN
jgi:hypothetical protein